MAAAIAWFYRTGSLLYFGDAEAHLNIARRIVDSRTPGWAQIGTTWLPLPHLLIIPWCATTGCGEPASRAPSLRASAMTIAATFLFAAVRRVFESTSAAGAAGAVFLLNPNTLYLGSIPMTEPVFFASLFGLLYFTVRFRETGGWGSLAGAAICALAGTLTRYEAWFMLPFVAAVHLAGARGARRDCSRRHCSAWWRAWVRCCGSRTTGIISAIRCIFIAGLIRRWSFRESRPIRGGRLARGGAVFFHGGQSGRGMARAADRRRGIGVGRRPARHLATRAAGLAAAVLLVEHSFGGARRFSCPRCIRTAGTTPDTVWRFCRWRRSERGRCGAHSRNPWRSPWSRPRCFRFVLHPSEHSVTWKEAEVNSRARREWTTQAAEYLRAAAGPHETYFTSFGDLTPIYRMLGVPLRDTLTGDNDVEWAGAVARPGSFSA